MYHFMFFYVFKIAMAIAFLCGNAVEAIQIQRVRKTAKNWGGGCGPLAPLVLESTSKTLKNRLGV